MCSRMWPIRVSSGTASTSRVSTDLAFVVTIENSGDFPELNVAVTLKIESGNTKITRTEHVAAIQPTEQATVKFTNYDLPPGDMERLAKDFMRQIPFERYPDLLEHRDRHFAEGPHRHVSAFEFGLDLILDGLRKIRLSA